jgi:hypothetical protein
VCLPAKVASANGQMGPVVLCSKVSNQITLFDPITMRMSSMDVSVDERAVWMGGEAESNGTHPPPTNTAIPSPLTSHLSPPFFFIPLPFPQAPVYYRTPFLAAANSKQMVNYVVLDIEIVRGAPQVGKYTMAGESQRREREGGSAADMNPQHPAHIPPSNTPLPPSHTHTPPSPPSSSLNPLPHTSTSKTPQRSRSLAPRTLGGTTRCFSPRRTSATC